MAVEVKADVKISGLDKLMEIFDKAIGRFFSKRDTDNKVYEMLEMAKAKAQSIKAISDAVKDSAVDLGAVNYSADGIEIAAANLLERTQSRIIYQEAKKQLNLEGIASVAAEELKDETSVPKTPLDEDWLSAFFTHAEDISSERLQFIWGKILAGEIKQPNSFSLRTLQLIKTLSKEEGDLIAKIANYVFKLGGQNLLFRGGNFGLGKYGITHPNITELVTIGILHAGDNTIMPIHHYQKNTPIYYGHYYVILLSNHQTEVPVYTFTKAGNELLKIVKQTPDFHYIKDLAIFLKKNGGDVKYIDLEQAKETAGQRMPVQEFEWPSDVD